MNRAIMLSVFLAALALVAGCGIGDAQTRLRTAVDAKNQELNQCYAAALERDRDAAGTVSAYLHVDSAQGRVGQVEFIDGDVRDPAFESCLTDSLTEVQLAEPPAANLKVEYTFQLSPRG